MAGFEDAGVLGLLGYEGAVLAVLGAFADGLLARAGEKGEYGFVLAGAAGVVVGFWDACFVDAAHIRGLSVLLLGLAFFGAVLVAIKVVWVFGGLGWLPVAAVLAGSLEHKC